MSLFQLAENTSAFLKMGIMGKQGAGKTKTAGKVAIGLVEHLKKLGVSYASKPVAMFDTETGSDYLIPDFKAANIPFVVAKTKTLADLLKGLDEAEANCSALIIDSITHPYRELIASYLRSKNRTFLQIDDWNYLKGEYGWGQFTKRYINSNLHIIMCGRAGDDLEQYVDENGKRQLEKIGTKMKTEAETGFEPSLLVLMEMIERRDRVGHAGSKRNFVNRATIMKDRWDKINGDMIDDPGFIDFLPHISLLALGGEHVGVRDTGDSQHILKTEKRDWQPTQRKIVLAEIEDLLVIHHPSTGAADKKKKIELLMTHFNASWVEIETVMSLERLRKGYDTLHFTLEGKNSRYHIEVPTPAETKAEMNDSLPEHSAPPVAPVVATAPAETPKPTIDETEVYGMPNFLRRDQTAAQAPEKIPTTKERLLNYIPLLMTGQDCLHWGLSMSDTFETLNKKDKEIVREALMQRQAELIGAKAKALETA